MGEKSRERRVVVPEVLPPATDAELHALWRAGVLSWKLWPQQFLIYDLIRSLPLIVAIIVILCARQFGKSVMALLLAIEDCLQNENILILIIAPDLKQGRKIIRQKMKLICRDMPKGLIRPMIADDTYEFPTTGSTIALGGYGGNAASERGQTLHKVILEEFGPDTDADGYLDFLRSDIGPALAHSKNAQMIFPTTLPKVPDHPFITETIPEAQASGSYYEFTIDDNKALSDEQKEKMIKLAGGLGSVECDRELFCKQVRDPLLVVVPEYVDAFHVRDFSLPMCRYMTVTGDMGGTRDKTCWLLHTYSFLEDLDLIWDEVVADRNTAFGKVLADARKKWGTELGREAHRATPDGKGFDVHLDAPTRNLTDWAAKEPDGFDFHALLVPKDDWQAGVNQMADRFKDRRAGGPRIVVHPRCTFLRLSLRSGTLNKTRDDFARTKTLGHCDALAALMYGLRTVRRENPYHEQQLPWNVVKREQGPTENEQVAAAIQPKTFGTKPGGGFQPKKFGKFKG